MYTEFIMETVGSTLKGVSEVKDSAKASICIIHGIGEHMGRYDHVIRKLSDAGYNVFIYDLPGHGKSEGKRGHCGSSDELMETVDTLIAHAKRIAPEKPIFVMGHSMGGNIALAHRFYRQSADVLGYISSSPWLKTTNNFLNNHLKLARFAADIFPNLCINNSAINVPLCVDRAMAPKNDLCHEKISLRTAADRERDARLVMENASKGRPVYLFTGDNDLVCIPSAARRFADLAGKSCVFRMWEGLGHETINESAWEDVLDAVITWLDGMLV